MTIAVLGLGSNLGDRIGHLRQALVELGDEGTAVSGVYVTPPWGDLDQPEYLNAAVLVSHADGDPMYWLGVARRLETAAGRVRDPERRFGPRTLDVDVIAMFTLQWEPVILNSPELTVPHPLAHLRAFVLRPWLDIQPDAVLPGKGPIRGLMRVERVAHDLAMLRTWQGAPLETIRRGPDNKILERENSW